MSWFDSSFSNFAKAALSNAQKSIDRALDIHDGGNADDEDQNQTQSEASVKKSKVGVGSTKKSTGLKASPVTENKTPQRSTSSTSARSAKSSASSDSFFDEFFESGSSSPEVKPVKTRSPLRKSASGPKTKQTKSLLKSKSEESRKQNVDENVSEKGENNKEKFSDVDLNEKVDEQKVTCKLEEQKNEGDNILKRVDDDALKVSERKDHPDAKQRQKEKDPDIPVEKKCSDSDDHSQSGSDNVDASKPKILHRKTVKDKANDDVKKLHRRSSESPSDGKSDQSDAGDDRMSLKSDSDFVVISDWNGSEISSVYDLRESSAVSSPKNMSCSSNGKRSPDSDFSVISDGKLSEMQEGIPMDAVLHKAPVTLSERFSPSYSADTESEKSSPSHSDHGGRRTPTPLGSDENGEDNRSREESPPKITMKLEEGLLKIAEKVAQHVDTQDPSQETADTSKPKETVENTQGGLDQNLHSPLPQDPLQSDKLLKKLAEQAEILQARERQIMTLSSQAIDYQETNNILRSQLKQVEELRETEQKDITNLTEEFTKRLASMESKLQGSQKERDNLKKQLTSTQKLLKEREGDTKMAEILKEKDEQVTELMAEGEKLSKQQLQNSKIIKKLRSKEKETEGVLKTLNEQLKESQERVTHLEEVLDAKEEVEKRNKEGIKVLNSAVERQEKEVTSLRLEVEESREKIRSTQAALDASYKEIAELNKAIAAKDSMVQESQLSAEMNAKESLRLALERAQQESRMDQETLALQVNDLRMSLSRSEQKYARKEDRLKQEICDLQQRLQEGEDRNQELSQNVSAATKPLLRQIENLQATFNAQSSTWEQVEKSLTERLVECQSQLATATEKERLAAEGSLEVNSKLASLESQVALLRQEKTKYLTALEMEKAKLQTLEDTVDRDALQIDSQRATYTKALEELQKDKALLERKLEVEKMKVEAEHKKLLLAQETIKEKEKRAQADDSSSSHSHTSRSSTPTKDERHHHHHSPSIFSPSQGEILERTISITGGISNVYDSVAAGSATSVMENLQSQLKQREGEITLYQGEITQLERTRGSMAEEIVNLANQKEQLEDEVKVLPDLKRKLNDLEHRYNAVLQMYGEKAEEVEELRLDLQDVKSMYRQQIEDLIRSK